MNNTPEELIYWAKVVSDKWKITGQFSVLNSEFDTNFELLEREDKKFIVKIMRKTYQEDFLNAQISILDFLKQEKTKVNVPNIIKSTFGNNFEVVLDLNKDERIVWVLEKIEGILFSDVFPKSKDLMLDLGEKVGALDIRSKKFTKDIKVPIHKWNLTEPLWIREYVSEIQDPNLEKVICKILEEFSKISSKLNKLPHFWIHNDLNDQNILVQLSSKGKSTVSGILDFGDLSKSPTICNVAICSAYLLILPKIGLELQLEFLRGYHTFNHISEDEIDILYTLIMTRLAVSFVNSLVMSKQKPDDPYVIISQEHVKKYLCDIANDQNFFTARFREACGFSPIRMGNDVVDFLNQSEGVFHSVIDMKLDDVKIIELDPENSIIPENPHYITEAEALNLTGTRRVKNAPSIYLGKYLEPRLIYTTQNFRVADGKNSNRRTIHLGIDVFVPACTNVFNPLEGQIVHIDLCQKRLDYGGFIVIEHLTNKGVPFFTLFGHLDPSSITSQVGDILKKGEIIGKIGNSSVNGGWEPHLHLQLALGLGQGSNWPGVCDPNEIEFWSQYCPNPAPLLGIDPEIIKFKNIDKEKLVKNRKEKFSGNLKLSYKNPILILRGFKNYIFDESGRCYLDFYNNVPHVGHSHPRIADLANKQLRLINSNTRYLHPIQKIISEKILSKFPRKFESVFFVNSGSEANELALRLTKTFTGKKDFITFDHSYHGNTNGVLEVSPYKFNKKNGIGKRDWVHVIDCPDPFRKVDPINQISKVLAKIKSDGRNLAGFISETFPSVAGQIIPKPGTLKRIYEEIRDAGGLCIADEVQTGLGRLGDYYFGFEQQQVIPDIVVLGKPIGNGHPIGAVITTKKISKAFDNGIEFFSTFGGSDLSCFIANEVLEIVDDEQLRENAKKMGLLLKKGLEVLKLDFPLIGDVRGFGLFLGVEIIRSLESKEPGTLEADYICNRLREERVLIGLEGPFENVLKIRPPLTLDENDVETFLKCFREILGESFLKNDL